MLQASRDPVFYSVVVVEVTRSAAVSAVLQFDVESVLDTVPEGQETGEEERGDAKSCLLVRSGSHH